MPRNTQLLYWAILFCLTASSCQQMLYKYNYRGELQTTTYDRSDLGTKEKLYLERLAETNSLADYKEYLKRYPEGVFADEAQQIITETEEYLLIAGKNSEELQYEDLETLYAQKFPPSDQDQDGIYDYLDKEPNTPAGYLIDEYGVGVDPEVLLDEQRAQLEKAHALGNLDYLRQFAKENPDSKLIPMVENLLRSGAADASMGEDPELAAANKWKSIEESEDINEVRAFIETYEGSEAAGYAMSRLEALEAAKKTAANKKEQGKSDIELSKGYENIDSPLEVPTEEKSVEEKSAENSWATETEPTTNSDSEINSGYDITTSASGGTGTDLEEEPDDDLEDDPEDDSDACLQNNINEGVLAFNLLPEKMYRDSLYEFHVEINSINEVEEVAERFSKRIGKEIDTEVINPVGGDTTDAGVVFEALKIGALMKVRLQANDEEAWSLVPQHSKATQKVDCEYPPSWNWDIKPLKEGSQRLRLIVEVVVDDEPKLIDDIPPKDIMVAVFEDENAASTNTPLWLWGGGIAGLVAAGMVWFFLVRRRKRAEASFGEAVGLAAMAPHEAKSIFIAYAPEDEEWTEKIYQQLKTLDKSGFVNIWYDKMVAGGEDYRATVMQHLQGAQVILLNVSADFLASDFCDEVIQAAEARVAAGEDCQILPILIRPCLWKASPVAKYPVFPHNEEALTSKEWGSEDDAIYQVFLEMEKDLLLPSGSVKTD